MNVRGAVSTFRGHRVPRFDIIGIDPRAVVRTEPRDWITNFESNYLPAIDFYEGLGAKVLREWLPVRLEGEPMSRLAANATGVPAGQ